MAKSNITSDQQITLCARINQARSVLASLLENGADGQGFSMRHEEVLGCLFAADELIKQAGAAANAS